MVACGGAEATISGTSRGSNTGEGVAQELARRRTRAIGRESTATAPEKRAPMTTSPHPDRRTAARTEVAS
ncbi:hypothetical protein SAMN04487848_3150 [Microbacterium sp. ru370.1]|nr:hypothetical protein SAMN04487848_3150 [Microbacterium sp. ru370.1]SIT93783.1 hypothetical protein SAMN05880579_3208 [Microbacterium sp. RU1D]